MRPEYLKYLFFISLIFSFIGCENKDIVSSVVDPGSISNSASISEPEWISLPVNEDNSLNEAFSVSKLVSADKQEFITFSRKYEGGELGAVSIACVIVFPAG